MSSSSLNKMTTPIASDQSAANQGLLMPKLKYRFRVVFNGFGAGATTTELTKQVMDFKRPEVSFGEVVVDVYNSKIKLLGKPTWQDVTCKFRDDANGNVSKAIGEQLQKQYDFMEQASASSGIDYKFTTRLEMLDGGNGAHEVQVLETWEMYGCYIHSASYGDVSYADDGMVETSLTLKFDNAVQTPTDTGIGSNIGRSLGRSTTG